MKNVAIIGCGKFVEGKEGWAIGHAHAHGYRQSGHDVKLFGVDVSADNLKAFGETFNLPPEQLFQSTDALYETLIPDVVSICTWPKLHHPMVMEAIQRGVKGIACEKPFTVDVGQQREIEGAAAEKNVAVVIAHQRRRDPAFVALKGLVRSGRIGESLQVVAHVGDGWDILSWTTHWFDMANFFFDRGPEWVMAGLDQENTVRYQQAVENASVIYADYGTSGSAIFLTGPGSGASFEVRGSKGTARIGDGCIEVATYDGADRVATPPGADAFAVMLSDLLAALDGGPEPGCSIKHCALATEMAYAAHESARTCRKIHLPLPPAHYAPLDLMRHAPRSGLHGRKLLLYADAHFGSGGREGIAEAFTDITGEAVRVVDAEQRGVTPGDLEGIDAILMYHTQKDANETTRKTLTDWVEAGRPLFIVHAGLGGWPEWSAYQEWCGFIWEWDVSEHPHEAATLALSDGDPFGFGWSEAWLPRDEVFIKLKGTAPIEMAMTASISSGSFPAAWRLRDKPNVGAWMPGHRRDGWRVPAMRNGAAQTLLHLIHSSAMR